MRISAERTAHYSLATAPFNDDLRRTPRSVACSIVVGYQTKDLASGNFTMLNVPFVNASDAKAGLQLNKDITVENVTASADGTEQADQIWIWNPSTEGYKRFFRYAGDGGDYPAGWCEPTGDWKYIENVEGYENGLPLGTAMYYKSKNGEGKALMGSGAIEPEDEVELAITGDNFTMIGNPYPVALQLNGDKFKVEKATANADGAESADQIWIWNPSTEGYKRFFLYAGDGDSYPEGWCEPSGDWAYIENVGGYENGIPSGTAMFYKARAGEGKKAIFTSPLVTSK